MIINAFVDPDHKTHFEIRDYPEVDECKQWVTENCPSAVWVNASGYSPHQLYIANEDEEHSFLIRYMRIIRMYETWYFVYKDGKYQRSIIDQKNLIAPFSGTDNRWGEYTKGDIEKYVSTVPSEFEVWEYDELGPLCGSAGYCAIDPKSRRLHSVRVVVRS